METLGLAQTSDTADKHRRKKDSQNAQTTLSPPGKSGTDGTGTAHPRQPL